MSKPPSIPNELFAYERKKRHWTQGDVADKISAPDERLIRRWERGEVAPTPHYRAKLAEVFGKSARELGFPPDGQISFWHMPYRRNAYFTGREDILQLLRDTLLAQHASPVPRLPLALSGLGGVGKSQIALEYAYRYREHYHTVLWLHAASYQDLVADVTAVADLLDLPGKDTANPAQLIETIKEWLTQLTRWLLIFDNVEHLQLLTGFLPDEPAEIKGHLLLTTRSQSTGTHAHSIAVEPMGSNTGAELLLRRAKLIAIESTLEHMAAADAATARSLSEDMGGLPLALDQAGAYIEETAVSLSEYVERYQKERRNLLDRRGSWVGDSEHPMPVAATLMLSFNEAGKQHPLATDILRFCAFLQPSAMPEELFLHDDSFKYGTTTFDEGIAALLCYSLIKRNAQEDILSMHRLLQAVLIEDMPPDLQQQWRERVVQALNAAFLTNESKALWQWGRLLPHVWRCTSWTEDELTHTFGVADLFFKAGIIESRLGGALGNIIAAFNFLMEGLRIHDNQVALINQYVEAADPAATNAFIKLAVDYLNQEKDDQAESLLQQALAMQEKRLGAGHPDAARTLSLLANCYSVQNKDEQAELSYRRAIKIFEEHPGTEYPAITLPLFGLAFLLHDQGRYEEAEELYQRTISIQEQQIGIMHPDTQKTRSCYAQLLYNRGRKAEAPALVANDEPPV